MTYVATVLADLPGTGSFWKYDEASGTLVDSGGGVHNSTVQTAITYRQPGPLNDGTTNYSLGFTNTSNSITSYGDIFDFTGTTAFSLEIWVKPTTEPAVSYLFNNLGAAGNNDGWRLFMDNTNLALFDRRLTTNDRVQWTHSGVGAWSHLVATYDGTNQRGYLNGALVVGPTASSLSLASNATTLSIGSYDGSSSVDGLIAFPAIYPSLALSAAQVLAHYSAATTPPVLVNNPVWPRIRFNG